MTYPFSEKELQQMSSQFIEWLKKKLPELRREFKNEQSNIDYQKIAETYHTKIHSLRQNKGKFNNTVHLLLACTVLLSISNYWRF